jgi:hypothetical protein
MSQPIIGWLLDVLVALCGVGAGRGIGMTMSTTMRAVRMSVPIVERALAFSSFDMWRNIVLASGTLPVLHF